jgi:hypothetical protein
MTTPLDDSHMIDNPRLSPSECKDRSREMSVDMSPEAVTRRLDLVDELRELAEELANAKRLGPVVCVPKLDRK